MFALVWETKQKERKDVSRANTIMMLQCLFCTICIQNFKICCFSIDSSPDAFADERGKSQYKNSPVLHSFLSFHFAFHQGHNI